MIGRSPMAEGVFRSLAGSDPRLAAIDSAGTGAYHTLEPPDYRTMDTLRKHGIHDYDHGARKIQEQDFRTFDYILAMDSSNLRDLQRLQKRVNSAGEKSKARVMLFGEFSGKSRAEQVGDPYYGKADGFEEVYEQVSRFSKRFLQEVMDRPPRAPQP
jgi:low molecular weight phosphotyrosine protein phosphatase